MQLITLFLGLSALFYQMNIIETQYLDIIQTALNNGNFKTLAAALQAGDLVTTLQATGPFTVFAPTDVAFNKLAAETLADLLKSGNKDKLVRILKYHVINGQKLTSSQINAMNLPTKVTMLEGDQITVSRDGNNLKVNDATVVIPDIMTTNGIIHVIDTVLIPPTSLATSFALNQSFSVLFVLTILFSYIRF